MVARLPVLATEFLLPSHCVGCRRPWRDWFCDDCAGNIRLVRDPFCKRCGSPLSRADAICTECIAHPLPDCLRDTRSVALYTGALARAIRVLKYWHAPAVAEPLGSMLADYLLASPLLQSPPLLVAVPLHAERLRERGFNQSELLARVISRRAGWDLEPAALSRQRNTRAQVTLDADARHANMRGAFDAPLRLDGRAVLLIDDVRTTGATLAECARALAGAGAGPIRALTLAREL